MGIIALLSRKARETGSTKCLWLEISDMDTYKKGQVAGTEQWERSE